MIDDSVRARIASYWLDQAASEHASIASFNRFALQLLALGAPASLVTATLDAARDEVRHAEVCFGLASRYSGTRTGPSTLELPAGAIPVDAVGVALETLRDGCLGESVASSLARVAALEARDPYVAKALLRIAEDEEAHAELAWRAVAWIAAEGGEPVYAAIDAFAAGLDAERPRAEGDEDEDLAAHGVLGASRQLAERQRVVREIVLPCLRALTARSAA